MTIRIVARFVARPETVEELRVLLLGLLEPTRKEPGCVGYELLHNMADPTDFTFLTPSDWVRIRLGDAERAGDVDRLVSELTRTHPQRDSVAPQIKAMVESKLRSAGQEDGAIEVHLSFSRLPTEQGDLPLAASLLVHLSPFPPGSTTAELLTSFAASGRGADPHPRRIWLAEEPPRAG